MAVSQTYKILWGTSIVFVILPHLNLGLLSDYKICGDSECESLMSRVQAIRDHHSKDCRFLSFKRGDTIFVYHKLTGKREDLWAGSIDRQFGYFPKDAVQEEQIYATMEKVVETQKSDFFCMNEFGYPIDSSHLDSDDDDDDQEIQKQESDTTQTTPYTDDTNAEIPTTSTDVPTESPVSAEEAEATSTEEDENKNAGDAAAENHKEARENPLNEQGGSAPSSWLGSSVTGWLGLAEEEAGNSAEGEKEDERKETQAGASVASSVTGWLGFGGEGQPDDDVKSREDSFTSTMTGWLGFGGEKRVDHSAEKEQDEEGENDEEPAEKFRSRRMSLDLEGSQLHEKERKEIGTLDWLGNGLSSTLGLGLTNQQSGHEPTSEREAKEIIQDEGKQPASGSWLDLGFRDILGFRNDKREVDESTGSGFKETEEGNALEQPTDSDHVDTSQSHPALTEGVTSNESNEEETLKDQNAPPEIGVNADSNNNDIGTSDSNEDSLLAEDAASKVDLKDILPQTELEKTSQAVGGTSNLSDDHKKEKNVLDGERSAGMEGKDHQMPKSIGKTGEEEIKTAGDIDQDFMTQSDTSLGPDLSSVDLNSNSMGQSLGEVDKDKTEVVVEKVAEISNQIDNTEEAIDVSVKIGASSHEGAGNNAETDVFQREISTTDDSAEQSQVSGGGNSQPLSSGTTEERNEALSNEDDSLAAHSVETNVDHSDSLAMMDENTETHQGELGQGWEKHPVEGSSQEFGSSDIMYENVSEEDRGTFSTSESTTQVEYSSDQDSVSEQQEDTQSDGDAREHKEIQTEKETIETETEEVEELKEVEEINAQEKQQEVEEEKQEEVEELQEEGKQEEMEEKQERVEELEEEEEQVTVDELKKRKKQEGMEEIKEEVNQEEVRELKEEEKQGDENELNEEEKKVEEIKEEKKLEEVEELLEGERQRQIEELKEEEEREELKEVEGVKDQEKKEGEEKRVQSHLEVEIENNLHSSPRTQKDSDSQESESNEKETQDENSSESVFSEMSTQTEKRQTENPQMEEEEREGGNKKQEEVEDMRDEMKEEEVEEKQEMENVEGERTDKEDDGSLNCSNELCPQDNEDRFVRDGDENDSANRLSSIDEGTVETGKQNPAADNDQISADMTGASQTVPAEGMERDEDEIQEEEEREEERNDDEKKKKDLLHSDESGQNSFPIQVDQPYSSAAKNSNLSDDNGLHQTDETETSSNGISTEKKTEQIHFDHKTDTEEDTDREEREINVKHADMQMKKQHHKAAGSEFRTEGGMDVSSSGPLISEQTVQSDHHNKATAETGSGGAFGLFKNAFSFFSQTPVTKTEGSTESAPGLDSNVGETAGTQASLPTEQELDSTPHPSQVSMQDLHTDSPVTVSQQELQPSPPFTETQTSLLSPTQTHSHPTETPLQTKTLSKHYKNLLAYISADEMTILTELFGRHKLQFLDYILGSSETMTDDPNHDESILLDIERLLHYHSETLIAPSMKFTDAPQEDKEKTRALIALQKLEMLLGRLRKTFNMGESDFSNTNHPAEASCVGESCSTHSKDKEMATERDSSVGLDNSALRDEWMGMDKEKDGRVSGGTGKERVTEDEKTGEKGDRSEEERVSPESSPHIQPRSSQPLEGIMRQILDFVHLIAEDSTTHVHAVREILTWLTVQSALFFRFVPSTIKYSLQRRA